MNGTTVAGIVTYNPAKERLIRNIEAVLSQLTQIIIVDNFSANRCELRELILSRYPEKVIWIQNEDNRGIAQALNTIFDKAQKQGYEWVLTLDQDTIIPNKLIETYSGIRTIQGVAQIACNIYENNTNKLIYPNNTKYTEIKRCITSGTITNIAAWKNVHGYDEYLFIDYVDYDFSMKLGKAKYKIFRCNNIYIEHELGNSQVRRFIFLPVRVTNYSAMRKYYISRNIIIYMRRYCTLGAGIMELLRLLRIICFTLLYETKKSEKIRAIVVGIKEGVKFVEDSENRLE